MNKRIQKKVAKIEHLADEANNAIKPVGEALKDVEASAQRLARSLMHEVEERAGEAIGQVRTRVAETRERAEHLLEKVPGVGPSAARALHDLSSR